jgi:hypothetical protein
MDSNRTPLPWSPSLSYLLSSAAAVSLPPVGFAVESVTTGMSGFEFTELDTLTTDQQQQQPPRPVSPTPLPPPSSPQVPITMSMLPPPVAPESLVLMDYDSSMVTEEIKMEEIGTEMEVDTLNHMRTPVRPRQSRVGVFPLTPPVPPPSPVTPEPPVRRRIGTDSRVHMRLLF